MQTDRVVQENDNRIRAYYRTAGGVDGLSFDTSVKEDGSWTSGAQISVLVGNYSTGGLIANYTIDLSDAVKRPGTAGEYLLSPDNSAILMYRTRK